MCFLSGCEKCIVTVHMKAAEATSEWGNHASEAVAHITQPCLVRVVSALVIHSTHANGILQCAYLPLYSNLIKWQVLVLVLVVVRQLPRMHHV